MTFWPSIQPRSRNPCANGSNDVASARLSSDRMPIRGTFMGCCASAEGDHTRNADASATISQVRRIMWMAPRGARSHVARGGAAVACGHVSGQGCGLLLLLDRDKPNARRANSGPTEHEEARKPTTAPPSAERRQGAAELSRCQARQ